MRSPLSDAENSSLEQKWTLKLKFLYFAWLGACVSNAAYEGEMTCSVRELKKNSIFEIPPRAFVRCIRSMLLPPLFLRSFMRPPVFGERANSQLNVGLLRVQ